MTSTQSSTYTGTSAGPTAQGLRASFVIGWLARLGAVIAYAILESACTALPRRVAPPATYRNAAPEGFPISVRRVDESPEAFRQRTSHLAESVRLSATSGTVNVLVLSGGGGGIAFGAGALVGWSEAGTRPEFQIVTGVSSGALLAPFALLGSDWDTTIVEAFTGARTEHLLNSHWWNALFGLSYYRGEPLFELVDHYVTDGLLRAVAAQAARGRVLVVATTDLDRERTVVWDMGMIAMQGGERSRALFRDILVASASIPGVFPPVLIPVQAEGQRYVEMHVDGGTTTPLFIAPEMAVAYPDGLSGLQGAKVYVIVNGQLRGGPRSTPLHMSSIARRGLKVALDSGSRATVEVAASLATEVGMKLQVTNIPDEYPYGGSLDLDRGRMHALFEYASYCAARGQLWQRPAEVMHRVMFDAAEAGNGVVRCPGPDGASSVPEESLARDAFASDSEARNRLPGPASAVPAQTAQRIQTRQ
jgi:predicted acylesterase/phospholipase RssA